MAVAEINLGYSSALGRRTSVRVILPDGKTGPFPVLYLLHGLSDDHTVWTRHTSLERYCEPLPFIVVMPDCERSFYVDAVDAPKAAFETYLTGELVPWVDGAFRSVSSREGRFVAGLSMGGYGALHLALKHPQLFGAAVSHSGAVAVGSRAFVDRGVDFHREMERVFGPEPAGTDFDLYRLSELINDADKPALRIDCGLDDFLIEDNRALHAHLETIGYAHEYAEPPGAHDWVYWNLHILDTLKFFCQRLGIEFRPEDHI